MTDFERLLQALSAGAVEYILIGGLAANAHGAIRTTRDVDVVYARSRANLERLETARPRSTRISAARLPACHSGWTCRRSRPASTSP